MRLFLLTFLLLQFSAIAQINVSNYIFRSKQHLMQNEYSQSIYLLNEVIRVRPQMYEPYFLRAISKYNLGDYKGAEIDFSESIALKPNFPDALMYRGICRERLMNFTAALNDFDRALALDAYHDGALVAKAFTKAVQENYDDAIELCNRAIAVNKTNEQAFLCRAWSKYKRYDLSGAVEDYSRALKINAFNADTYTKRAMVYAFELNYTEALKDLNRSLELDSLNLHTLYQLAEVHKELDERDLALEFYSRMITVEPESPIAYFERGQLLSEAGETDRAIDDYTMVVVLTGGHLYSYFNRGSLYYQQGKFSAAVEDLSRAIELYPDFAEAYYNRSLAYSRLGMHPQASADSERAREIKSGLYAMDETQQQQELKKLQDIAAIKADFNHTGSTEEIKPAADYFILPEEWVPDSLKNEALYLKALAQITGDNGNWVVVSHQGWPVEEVGELSNKLNEQLSEHPDNIFLLVQQGVVFQLMQNYELALEVYDAVLREAPDNPIALLNRSYVLNKMLLVFDDHPQSTALPVLGSSGASETSANFKQIASGLERIIEKNPDFVPAQFNLANLYAATGSYGEARQVYQHLVEAEPGLKPAQYNLGLTLLYLNESEKACQHLSRAGELGYLQAYTLIKKYCRP